MHPRSCINTLKHTSVKSTYTCNVSEGDGNTDTACSSYRRQLVLHRVHKWSNCLFSVIVGWRKLKGLMEAQSPTSWLVRWCRMSHEGQHLDHLLVFCVLSASFHYLFLTPFLCWILSAQCEMWRCIYYFIYNNHPWIELTTLLSVYQCGTPVGSTAYFPVTCWNGSVAIFAESWSTQVFTLKFSPLIENPKSWNLKEHLGAGMNKAAPGSLRSSSNIKEKKGQVSLRRRRRRLVLWSHPSCPCHPCRYSKIKLQEGGSHPTHDSLLQSHSPVLVANIIFWHISHWETLKLFSFPPYANVFLFWQHGCAFKSFQSPVI